MTTYNEVFNSLTVPTKDKHPNKYWVFSYLNSDCYRIINGYDAYKYREFLGKQLMRFIMEESECVVMPNKLYSGEIVGFLFRSMRGKKFRYMTDYPYIPYGAGANIKTYNKPWLIVESAIDSDYLRQFYPYVIATRGVTVKSETKDFIKGTCKEVLIGFDDDDAGKEAYIRLCGEFRRNGLIVSKFYVHSLGNPITEKKNKDFGDTIDAYVKGDFMRYEVETAHYRALLSTL